MKRQTQSLPNVNSNENQELTDKRSLSYSRISLFANKGSSPNLDYLHHYKHAPFNLRWIYGYNHKVEVINLNNKGSTVAFYAAANCGVLYNWSTHQMKILQGHKHIITSLSNDSSGEWLVTSDSGPENVIIIWCSTDLFPQKTIFSPHGTSKVAKVAMSADAKYLLTIGYSDNKVVVNWWIWSFGLNTPHASTEIDSEKIIAMGFDPCQSEQFILLSKLDLWIGIAKKIVVIERGVPVETDKYELLIRKPFKVINPEYGNLTCFNCVEKTRQILVGTSRGAVLVYGYDIEYNESGVYTINDFEQFRFVKVLRIEKRRINVIKNVDNVVVTGNRVGQLHFYDEQLKLLYWMHELPADNIVDISFNMSPRSYKIFDSKCKKACVCWEKVETEVDPVTGLTTQKLLKMKIPYDATTSGKPIVVRDFIVCTVKHGVRFVDFITEKNQIIIDNRIANVCTMSVHPSK